MYFVSVYCVLAFDSKDVHNRAVKLKGAGARRGSRGEPYAKRSRSGVSRSTTGRVRRARSARRSGNNFAQPYARQYSYAHRGHLHRVVVPATGGT